MTNNELADLLEEAARILRSQPVAKKQMSLPTLITKEDQAKRLSVSVSTLMRGVRSRKIPVVKLGRSVRFNPEAVERAIDRLTIHEVGHKKPQSLKALR